MPLIQFRSVEASPLAKLTGDSQDGFGFSDALIGDPEFVPPNVADAEERRESIPDILFGWVMKIQRWKEVAIEAAISREQAGSLFLSVSPN